MSNKLLKAFALVALATIPTIGIVAAQSIITRQQVGEGSVSITIDGRTFEASIVIEELLRSVVDAGPAPVDAGPSDSGATQVDSGAQIVDSGVPDCCRPDAGLADSGVGTAYPQPDLSTAFACSQLSNHNRRWELQVFLDHMKVADPRPDLGGVLVGGGPGGRYVLTYPETSPAPTIEAWELEIRVNPPSNGTTNFQIVDTSPGRIVLDVPTDRTMMVRTNIPWSDMHWVPLAFEDTYQTEVFYPNVIEKVSRDYALRAIQLTQLNYWYGSDGMRVPSWSTRVGLADRQSTAEGVAIEYVIDLANRAGVDLYHNLRHSASDNYARQVAELIRDRLSPNARVYIAVGNEVWNAIPPYQPQQAFFVDLASSVDVCAGGASRWEDCPGYVPDTYAAAIVGHAQRTVDVGDIFKEVLGEDRVIVVLEQQVGLAFFHDMTLHMLQAQGNLPDMLAIAPYFGGGNFINLLGTTSTANILDALQTQAVPQAIEEVTISATSVAQFGIPLGAYEGGIHMLPPNPWDEAQRTQLAEVNTAPEMEQIYDNYMAGWIAAGGGMFCHYGLAHQQDGMYGAWGLYDNFQEVSTSKVRGYYSRVLDKSD